MSIQLINLFSKNFSAKDNHNLKCQGSNTQPIFGSFRGTKTMSIIKSFLIFLFIIPAIQSQPTLLNINVRSSEDSIYINYDIWSGYSQESYFVECEVSRDGGASFNIIPRLLQGDIGYGIKNGDGKKILWEPLKEGIELVGDKFIFRLKLSVLGSSPNVEFVQLKGNTFNLGDEFRAGDFDEKPVLSVKIDDFEISKFEITNAQFSSFLKSYGSTEVKSGEYEGEKMIYEYDKGLKYLQGSWVPSVGYENFPIVGVTWYGAMEFCKYFHYRLPTEAEWEYAAKELGKMVKYGNGNDIANIKQINFNFIESNDSTLRDSTRTVNATQQSVGAYAPNILGIFQMSGNVWEWCLDWYEYNHNPNKIVNPTGPWFGKYKVIRGGSFNNSATSCSQHREKLYRTSPIRK